MKKRTQGIVITRPPYGSENARQALDMALAFSAFEQPVTLFFQGDGLWNLVANNATDATHATDALGLKQWTATLGELAHYDIDDIIVCQHEMTARQLQQNQFCIPVQILTPHELGEKMQTLEQLWVF